MDNAILVKELRNTISALRKTQGHVALFILTSSEANVSIAQNIIVSTHGYDKMSKKDALIHLINLLKTNLSESSLRQLARLAILKTDDPFVKAVNQAFNVKNSSVSLQSSNIFGIHIENALILESVSLPQKKIKPLKIKQSKRKKLQKTKKANGNG